MHSVKGIHHITAITGDPQSNIDFYADVLGMRMVKLTVNFDDPTAYHLYYGDELGNPGSALTFFSWPGAPKGLAGAGQAREISFLVPSGALEFWSERLGENGIKHENPVNRFGEKVMVFYDPDGLKLSLVESAGAQDIRYWKGSPVPAASGIRGFHGVTLTPKSVTGSIKMLTEVMGFTEMGESGGVRRLRASDADPRGSVVDVIPSNHPNEGIVAVGTIHHVAFRTANDESQRYWRSRIAGNGLHVTRIIDRKYFHSIYFREPGGVLYEIATDGPGFTVDEPAESLGSRLQLPPWFEPDREMIEKNLPPVTLGKVRQGI